MKSLRRHYWTLLIAGCAFFLAFSSRAESKKGEQPPAPLAMITELRKAGQFQEALNLLETVPVEQRQAEFFALRAGIGVQAKADAKQISADYREAMKLFPLPTDALVKGAESWFQGLKKKPDPVVSDLGELICKRARKAPARCHK